MVLSFDGTPLKSAKPVQALGEWVLRNKRQIEDARDKFDALNDRE